jgi:hypothetical protein
VRGILDTNLLVSALISPSGVPDKLYRAWRDGRFTLVSSAQQLEEFKRVTRYPTVRKFIRPAGAGDKRDLLFLANLRRTQIVTARQLLVRLRQTKRRT